MARLKQRDGAIFFSLRLTPRGGRDAVEGWMKDAGGAEHLKARVAAPPESGKANAALIALLSRALGVPKSRIGIAGGETARRKTISISSAAPALAVRLQALGERK